MPDKYNEPRRHKIPRARYRIQNWPEYDRALQRRGDLTVWVTPEAIAAWCPPRGGRRGRPRDYSDVAIATGHLLWLAFGRPWRPTEGLLRSIAALLGLELGIPDHTTFSRRSPGLVLATALARAQAGGGPVHVVIDATGLKVFGAGEWLAETHGARGKRTWRKLHLAVDPEGGEILACGLTTNEEGDASQVGLCSSRSRAPSGRSPRTGRTTVSRSTGPCPSISPIRRWTWSSRRARPQHRAPMPAPHPPSGTATAS